MTPMSVDTSAAACPRCASPAPPDARFCMTCGQPLGEVSGEDEARQARLSAVAPVPLVEKMRTARLTGERKPVTALFADVVGSTALAEQMDPEDWTQVITEAFDLMSRAVFRYEGTIAQLMGDGMLAFFGAPVAHEDDPERAVRAALDMVEEIGEFARQLKDAHGIDFALRVGINNGLVLVGNVGTDLRYEYTAIGDAVNTAARMQAAAEPGTVLITANTQRQVGVAFELEDVGELEVKGKSEPVHAYRVLRAKSAAGPKRGLAAVGLESPLVGRDLQLEKLRELWAIVAAGRGRVCLLTGDPGIGKSRLLAELRRGIKAVHEAESAAEPWIEGRAISYGRNVPYHLVIDLVRATLEIPISVGEDEARRALDARLAELIPDEATDSAPYLAHLLDLPLRVSEADRTLIDPEVIQQRYTASIQRLLRARSARAPLALVCEDLHWADTASVDVLRFLLPLVTQLPVLLLLTMREERDSAGWDLVKQAREVVGEALTEIRLEPLSLDDSRSLVGNLLAIESLPERVRELILTRADGNPFFVEEVVRMLIERGVIERRDTHWVASGDIEGVDIPETLHSLLLARIDQLPDDAKRSLRVAAVIGRQFPVRVLERVLGETVA